MKQTDAIAPTACLLSSLFLLPRQTSIAIKFQPATTEDGYTVQWKRHEQSWGAAAAQSKQLNVGATKAEIDDLEPGTTYCIRLTTAGGEVAGPELILDTEQVGCTPKPNRSCCVVS